MRIERYRHLVLLTALCSSFVIAGCANDSNAQRAAECGQYRHQSALAAEALGATARGDTGILGACVGRAGKLICENGDLAMPMQSVVKLLVAIAAFEQADAGVLRLDEVVEIDRDDLSLEIQPIADLVAIQGVVRLPVLDLIRRMVTESDSAATDILIERLGGPKSVEAILIRLGAQGLRVDRYERELQSELSGLKWQKAFVDQSTYDRAKTSVSFEDRRKAIEFSRQDPRDRATARGVATLLNRLSQGDLLSDVSSRKLIAIMEETRTFPDRLVAGVPAGWTVAHKTGSSRTIDGVTDATNDVGILTAPNGDHVVAVAFLSMSRASDAERASAIARVATIGSQWHLATMGQRVCDAIAA